MIGDCACDCDYDSRPLGLAGRYKKIPGHYTGDRLKRTTTTRELQEKDSNLHEVVSPDPKRDRDLFLTLAPETRGYGCLFHHPALLF